MGAGETNHRGTETQSEEGTFFCVSVSLWFKCELTRNRQSSLIIANLKDRNERGEYASRLAD
jgi:hypothetical protein